MFFNQQLTRKKSFPQILLKTFIIKTVMAGETSRDTEGLVSEPPKPKGTDCGFFSNVANFKTNVKHLLYPYTYRILGNKAHIHLVQLPRICMLQHDESKPLNRNCCDGEC